MRFDVNTVIALGALVLRLGRVNRATFHEDGVRPETDTDHTVMLGVIASVLAQSSPDLRKKLDSGKVAVFALVHDLVEAYAGDVQTFDISALGRTEKHRREQEAFERIAREFFDLPWLGQLLTTYEKQEDINARFVRYLDKAMPKIVAVLNGGVTIKRLGKSRLDFENLNAAQRATLRMQYPEFPEVEQLMTDLGAKVVGVLS